MSKKKIPVTEEQFLQTVDKWIFLATGEGEFADCGFCDAMQNTTWGRCENCLAYHICGDLDSPYTRWAESEGWNKEAAIQAALEMLEGLYEVGVKLGFYEAEDEGVA